MILHTGALLALFISTSAYADRCIQGLQMESRPTRDSGSYPGDDRVVPQEFQIYQWNAPRMQLSGAPNSQFGMFLYSPSLGGYVRGWDWSYCPSTRTIKFHRRPILTREYRYVYDNTGLWVHYAQ